MMNFLLFFISSLLLGGDGLNGKIEAGHYYLGNHGDYTEVICPIYLLSRAQGILLFVSWPFVMVAALVSWTGVGSERNDDIMHAIYLGRAFDLVEGFFSLLFDSWRKPDLKLFTRLAPTACIQEILTLPDWIVRDALKRQTLNLTWGGHHFELSRYTWSAWKGGAPIVLHGRLYSTSHGTYIKAWYRWSTMNLLFLSIFVTFGLMLLLSGFTWLVAEVLGINPTTIVDFLHLTSLWGWRLSVVIGLLLVIAISARLGRRRRRDLAHLVKEALTTDSLAHPTRSSRDIRQLT